MGADILSTNIESRKQNALFRIGLSTELRVHDLVVARHEFRLQEPLKSLVERLHSLDLKSQSPKWLNTTRSYTVRLLAVNIRQLHAPPLQRVLRKRGSAIHFQKKVKYDSHALLAVLLSDAPDVPPERTRQCGCAYSAPIR